MENPPQPHPQKLAGYSKPQISWSSSVKWWDCDKSYHPEKDGVRISWGNICNEASQGLRVKLVLSKHYCPSFPVCLYVQNQDTATLQFWHLLDFVGFPVPYNCWVNLFQTFSFPFISFFLSLSSSACIPLPECSKANSLLRLLLLPPRCPSGVDTPDHGVHLLGLLELTLVTLLNLEIQDCRSSGFGKGHAWLLSI